MADPEQTQETEQVPAEAQPEEKETTDENNSGDSSTDTADAVADSAGADDDSSGSEDVDGEQSTTGEDDTDATGEEASTGDELDEEAKDAAAVFAALSVGNEGLGDNMPANYRIGVSSRSTNAVWDSVLADVAEKFPGGIAKGRAVEKEDISPNELDGVKPVVDASYHPKTPTSVKVGLESYTGTLLSDVNIIAVYEVQKKYMQGASQQLDRMAMVCDRINPNTAVGGTYTPDNQAFLMCSSSEINDGDQLLDALKQSLNAIEFSNNVLATHRLAYVKGITAALATAARTGDVKSSLDLIFNSAVQHNNVVAKLVETKLVPANAADFNATVSGVSTGFYTSAVIKPLVPMVATCCLANAVRDKIEDCAQLFTSGLFVDVDPLAKRKSAFINISIEQLKEAIEIGKLAVKTVIDYEKQAKALHHALEGLVEQQRELLKLIDSDKVVSTPEANKNIKQLAAALIYRFAGGNADLNTVATSVAAIAADLSRFVITSPTTKSIQSLNLNIHEMNSSHYRNLKAGLESMTETDVDGNPQPVAEQEPVAGENVQPEGEASVDTTPGPEAALADIDVSPEDTKAVINDLAMQEEVADLDNSVTALESLRDSLSATMMTGSPAQMRTALVRGNQQHNALRARLNMGYLPNVAVESHGGIVPAMEGLVESITTTIKAALAAVKKFFTDIKARRAEAALRARAQRGDIVSRLTLIKRKASLLSNVKGQKFNDPKIMQNLGLWAACPDVRTAITASQDFHDVYVRWLVGNYDALNDMIAEVKRGTYDGVRKILTADIMRYATDIYPNEKDRHAVMPNLSRDQYVRFAPAIPGNSALGVVMPDEIYNERYSGDRIAEIRTGDFSGGVRKGGIVETVCATEDDVAFLEQMVEHWDAAFIKGREAFSSAISANNDANLVAQWIYQTINENRDKSLDAANMAYRYFGQFMYNALTAFNVRSAMRFTVFSAALSWVEESIKAAEAAIAAKPNVEVK